ncbi:MAG TPA: hypothetical protein VFA56_07630 [Gaiellaceae bacterium]|nr:hypothetical protein [Gaiellaceae bacterium]
MASVKDVEQVADDLETLVGELRSELQNGQDFEKLTQIADEISEHADRAAETFSSVNETLMSRIGEITGSKRGGQKSGGQSRAKAQSSSSS